MVNHSCKSFFSLFAFHLAYNDPRNRFSCLLFTVCCSFSHPTETSLRNNDEKQNGGGFNPPAFSFLLPVFFMKFYIYQGARETNDAGA